MPRKKVISGGKRDEIIEKAMNLFIEKGYENTSVRMILDTVNGEPGMFYYYFKSKEELFDITVQYFMDSYEKEFEAIVTQPDMTCGMQIIKLLEQFEEGNRNFKKLGAQKMHWTIAAALHQITVEKAKPTFRKLIMYIYKADGKEDVKNSSELADFIMMGLSGLLHNDEFSKKNKSEQLREIIELISRILDVPVECLMLD